MAATNDAQIWGVLAASGSGKGIWIKDQLRRLNPPRLVIYDFKDEYGEFAGELQTNLQKVRLMMRKAGGKGPLRVRFISKKGTEIKQRLAEFQMLCTNVQGWMNCTFVAEELSNVTTPSWAPPAWREMTTGGRHEGIHIIGVAQNPALIDKTFLSNCTMIHVGPLREYAHRQAVARSMDVPVDKVTALAKFHWLERVAETRELREGHTFPPDYKPPVVPTGSGSDGSGKGRATGKRKA